MKYLDINSILSLKSTNKYFYMKLLKYRIEPFITKAIVSKINSMNEQSVKITSLAVPMNCRNCNVKILKLNHRLATLITKTPKSLNLLPEHSTDIKIDNEFRGCIVCIKPTDQYCVDCDNLRSDPLYCLDCTGCTICKIENKGRVPKVNMDGPDCSSCSANICKMHLDQGNGWYYCEECDFYSCGKCIINDWGGYECPICTSLIKNRNI
tara:strand:- start:11861 stop:12487 length:627 start_codon:yes stop_codon:yes gene_type:complete